MTTVREYPVMEIKMPSDLAGQPNGKLDPKLLRTVNAPAGQMHHMAATAWNCLQLAAFFAGIELKHVGAYRSFDRQLAMFNERYSATPTGRTPEVTRTYEGKKFFLKKGVAPSSSPGQSNHGWGLAIDVANASGKRLEWMLGDQSKPFGMGSPVVQYGFSWEVKDPKNPNAEAWHIRYCTGDTFTPAVEEALKAFPNLRA